MAIAFRRVSIWFVVLAVALASAYMGFQLAQGQSPADIGRTVGLDTMSHKDGHKVPPACYNAPPHAAVQEKNKHCNP